MPMTIWSEIAVAMYFGPMVIIALVCIVCFIFRNDEE